MERREHTEDEEWLVKGNFSEKLDKLEHDEYKTSCILLQHFHYKGGCAPNMEVLFDMEQVQEYIDQNTYAGDNIKVWFVDEEGQSFEAIVPDNKNLIPYGENTIDEDKSVT